MSGDGKQTSKLEYSLQSNLNMSDTTAGPQSGGYSGYFFLQVAGHSAPIKVIDDMALEFSQNTIGTLNVCGQGQNRYGYFSVYGTCETDGCNLELARAYAPKVPRPKPSALMPSVRKPGGKDLSQIQATLTFSPTQPDSDGKRSGRTRKVPLHLRDGIVAPEKCQAAHATSEALKRCFAIVTSIARSTGADWFSAPVDAVALGVPHYNAIVDAPMDLATIKSSLDRGGYTDPHMFAADLRLVFRNAMTFNILPEAQVHEAARDLHAKLEDQLKNLWKYMAAGVARGKPGFKRDSEDSLEGVGGKRCKISSAKSIARKEGRSKTGPREEDISRISVGAGMVPVADLVSMQRQMESMQATIAALQKQASQTEVQVQMNMELGVAPSAYRLPKLPRNVKALTFDEKETLSNDINALPPDKLAHVVKIVQESMPLTSRHNNDEIEVDIEALDNDTLRNLQKYVKESIGKKRAGKRKGAYAPEAAPTDSILSSDTALASSDARMLESVAFGGADLGPGFDSDDDNELDYDVLA